MLEDSASLNSCDQGSQEDGVGSPKRVFQSRRTVSRGQHEYNNILCGLEEDHSLEEVYKICRVCLNTASIPIFSENGNISEQINEFGSIDVTEGDCLPQHICTQCWELLEFAIIFRKIAQKSDSVLRNRAKDCDSQGSQCDSVSINHTDVTECTASSDGENSETGVYLEYDNNDTANESATDIDESDSITDNLSIPENIEQDAKDSITHNLSIPENVEQDAGYSITDNLSLPDNVKTDTGDNWSTLVDSFNKKAGFLQCELCNMTFRTIEQLDEHSSEHDSEEIIKCEVCNNIIHTDLYSVHLKLHRESFNQRIKKKYQKVDCTVCGKSTRKTYMKKHMVMHSADEGKSTRFKKCTICDKLISVSYMSVHINHKHKQKVDIKKSTLKIKCPICYRMCKESTYKNHVATHAIKQKRYICEQCGKEFHALPSFMTHKLTHKEEYKYKCQFCPYQGKHLGLLKVHVRTHTKDYLYKCSTCNASFINKSNLNAHEKTHVGGVKFICSRCGKCFALEGTLLKHMVSVHEGINAFACDICGKSYGNKVVMVAHKRKIHHVPYVRRIGRIPSYLLGVQGDKVEDDT